MNRIECRCSRVRFGDIEMRHTMKRAQLPGMWRRMRRSRWRQDFDIISNIVSNYHETCLPFRVMASRMSAASPSSTSAALLPYLFPYSLGSENYYGSTREEPNRRRCPSGTRIRRANLEDVDSIAALCGEAFHPGPREVNPASSHSSSAKDEKNRVGSGNGKANKTKFKQDQIASGFNQNLMNSLLEASNNNPLIVSTVKFVEKYQKQRLEKAVSVALRSALRRKRRAIGVIRRRARGWSRFESVEDATRRASDAARDDSEYLRESRYFQCFVCEEVKNDCESEIIGCVFCFLYRAEAESPPPLPTSAPFRMYLSNLSVNEKWRRRGVADALVMHAERLSSLWGHNEMLLHVQPENTIATKFYRTRGYKKIGMKWWSGEELMRKPLRKFAAPFLQK